MKVKQMILLIVFAGILFMVIGLTGGQAQAQTNLLVNPGFEEGYTKQDGIPEITAPNNWRVHWLDGVTFPGSNGVANRPETVVWNIKDAPPEEQTLFFRDGSYAFKLFKNWGPILAGLSQDVTGLEVGRRYRFTAPIYVDIVKKYSDRKIPPDDLDAGQVRLGAGPTGSTWGDENAINYSPWWTAGTISPFYLAYTTFSHEFTATSENMTVYAEMGSKQPYVNEGFFMDGFSLVALDNAGSPVSAPASAPAGAPASSGAPAAVAAGPTAPPAPTVTPRADGAVVHIVQVGDTFWSLAIQYAGVMGLTAEEALAAIPALNNNPTTINPGDELIIVAPKAEPTPEPTVVEEATPEAEVTREPATVEATEVSTTNGVCVVVYEDANKDAVYSLENENLLADVTVSLLLDGATEASYVTDGANEPHCFEDLEPGTYQVQVFPPEIYQATTPESWAIAVSNGVIIPVAFGLAPAPEATAAAGAAGAAVEDGSATVVAETAVPENAQAEESGGSGNIVGGILLIGAAFVVLLAGVGVFLLRRG